MLGFLRQVGARVASLAGPASHLLFPKICVACGQADGGGDAVLCRKCRAEMGRLRRRDCCLRCGLTVGPFAARDPCGRCPSNRIARSVLRIGEYATPLREIVTSLKYGGREELAEPLADGLARRFRRLGIVVDLVVPIPLHHVRRRLRGFNQAELIARSLARRLDRPMADALLRTRDTPTQTAASAAQRRVNVAGCFEPSRRAAIVGRRVLLVDDVMTTGSTIAEAGRTLRRAGAAGVWSAVAAVAPLPAARPTEDPIED